MSTLDTRDARIALEHMDTFCQNSVCVDPIGPKKTILSLLDAVDMASAFSPHVSTDSISLIPPVTGASQRANRVYISGPMTGFPGNNRDAFIRAAETLKARGFTPVSPTDLGEVDDAEYGDYLRADIALLVSCEFIMLLPGWAHSNGAIVESTVAAALGLKVLDSKLVNPTAFDWSHAPAWATAIGTLENTNEIIWCGDGVYSFPSQNHRFKFNQPSPASVTIIECRPWADHPSGIPITDGHSIT